MYQLVFYSEQVFHFRFNWRLFFFFFFYWSLSDSFEYSRWFWQCCGLPGFNSSLNLQFPLSGIWLPFQVFQLLMISPWLSCFTTFYAKFGYFSAISFSFKILFLLLINSRSSEIDYAFILQNPKKIGYFFFQNIFLFAFNNDLVSHFRFSRRNHVLVISFKIYLV